MSDDLAAAADDDEWSNIIWWWVGGLDVKDELDLEDTSHDDVDVVIEKALDWRIEEHATTEAAAAAASEVSRDGGMLLFFVDW